MRRLTFGLAAALVTTLLLPSVAVAQERIGDGVLGAVAGALVAGPVGAVAGGAIGYGAGPHIARGLRGEGHRHRYRHRRPRHGFRR